ncbi:phenoloxidase-activating factor 2-like [Drosophila ficusphila]|uniref:phenoloxidase-activating factor 2-like n=1 Tax=Drosophila ficusphila TaxID=30025 RepID=UPI001C8AE98B|nr:phenoloxidase-activating factor 2-like [Drosophila ficusphila]
MSRILEIRAILLSCILYGVAGQDWMRTFKVVNTPIPPLSNFQSAGNERCGLSNPDGLGIDVKVTGDYTRPGQYPWVVALFNRGQFFAGGSLIKPGVVLTASYPLESKVAEDIIVKAGAWNISALAEQLPREERQVDSIVRHENFTFGFGGNNIALLFLSSPFELKTHIRTMCLPRQRKPFEQGRCFVAGWRYEPWHSQQLGLQEQIPVTLVNREICQNKWRKDGYDPDFVVGNGLICAERVDHLSACTFFRGSPLFCPTEEDPARYEQAAIVDWGFGCSSRLPKVYTNVAFYRNWIDQQVANKPQF